MFRYCYTNSYLSIVDYTHTGKSIRHHTPINNYEFFRCLILKQLTCHPNKYSNKTATTTLNQIYNTINLTMDTIRILN